MTNDKIWRAIPLKAIMPKSYLLDDLSRAGYETAGDILDAEPSDMVRDVKGIGLKRAVDIRQKVFDAVKPPYVVVEGEIGQPTDTLMKVVALIGVAIMVYMAVRMAL
jgi:hypothetical protein